MNIKLSKNIENLKEIDNNLGRTNTTINKKIMFNDYECSKLFMDFKYKNSLQYKKTPERSEDWTMHNNEIECKYIPTASFSFGDLSPLEYQKIIQIINTKEFYMELYDYEIGKWTKRLMYATKIEHGALNLLGGDENNFHGILKIQVTVVSKFAYKDYDELISKAIEKRST